MQIRPVDIRVVLDDPTIFEIEFNNPIDTKLGLSYLATYQAFLLSCGMLPDAHELDAGDPRTMYLYVDTSTGTCKIMRYQARNEEEALLVLELMRQNYNIPTTANA